MLPSQLKPEQFNGYPPQARQIAESRIVLMRQLPLSFLPLLLREVIVYDWKFPAERRELEHQLSYLGNMPPERVQQYMVQFSRLHLSPELEHMDWVHAPRLFSEQLTAHLWATQQIDNFREAALEFGRRMDAVTPPESLPLPRLAVAVIGRGVAENTYPLFRKLRPWGVYFKRINSEGGTGTLLKIMEERAKAHPVPFGHWYVEGDTIEALPLTGITCVSYGSLDKVRGALVAEMRKAVESGSGPEALRTSLAQALPEDVGMNGIGDEGVLNRFQLSMLTEGSGTQFFSTTFVQWSAREALRRAQPLSLLARFAPRQRDRSMNELLARPEANPELDPRGSLIDADMGAYYTWINQQRLPGANRSSFVVWFEDHHEAVAVGPSMPRGTESSSEMSMQQLVDGLL